MCDGNGRSPIAQSPFDDADADVILHTSDHVDFRVFRLILTLSSPFFQGMFALPQPATPPARPNDCTTTTTTTTTDGDAIAGPPSIAVPEDSTTLDALLRFLYPNTHARPFRDLSHACNVAAAASKYTMDAALDRIADEIRTRYASSHPLQVYFIACRIGSKDVARAAARYCLDADLVMEAAGDVGGDALVESGLLDFPGAAVAYHRLEAYRHECRRALDDRIADMELFDLCATCAKDEGEGEDKDKDGISGPCLRHWLTQYAANVSQTVFTWPRKEALADMHADLVPESKCRGCSISVASSIATALLTIASDAEDILSEVELRFGS